MENAIEVEQICSICCWGLGVAIHLSFSSCIKPFSTYSVGVDDEEEDGNTRQVIVSEISWCRVLPVTCPPMSHGTDLFFNFAPSVLRGGLPFKDLYKAHSPPVSLQFYQC